MTETHKIAPKHMRVIAIGLIGLGIAGLVLGGFMLVRNKPSAVARVKSVNVEPAPSSKKPSQSSVESYTVPPTNPRYINIPAINITNTPIIKLGLLKSGAIAAPANIFEAGWYKDSSLPGQKGAMFIYGHVSSWTAKGLFYSLHRLKAGDTVKIVRGDNTTYTYKVISSKTYPYDKVNMNEVLSPIDTSRPGLNLMTCTGQVIKGTSEFNQRLVIFTSLVS